MSKVKFVKVAERRYAPFPLSLNIFGSSLKDVKGILDCDFDDMQIHFRDGVYWTENMEKNIADCQIEEYKKQGAEYLMKLAQLCENQSKVFIDYCSKVSKDNFSSMSDVQLSEKIKKFFDELRKVGVFITVPLTLGKFLDGHLDEILGRHVKDDREVKEFHNFLSLPLKLNWGQYESISFYEIALKFKKEGLSLGVKKMIQEHLKKYDYFSVRWMIGKRANFDSILERLNHVVNEDIEKKILEMKNSSKKIKEESKEICDKLKLTKEEREFVDVVKEYVYIRTYRTDVLNESYGLIEGLLREIAKRLKISYDDLLYLTIFEVINSLIDRTALERIRIDVRKREQWAMFREGEELYLIEEEDDSIKMAKEYGIEVEDFSKINELKGSCAWKGKVKGIAKVVLSPVDISKVKKGDVLVSVMTFPSYIVAMEKASAFVTDEGGVLCHAAIISREMNKPCVIGTKVATKVFKDGDEIEADADKGIVKIIKRK